MRCKPTAPLQKVTLINVGTCSDLIKPFLINTLHDWEPGSEVKKDLSPWASKPVLWPDPVRQVWWWWRVARDGSPQAAPRVFHRPYWVICISCTNPKKKIFTALGDDLGNFILNLYGRNSSEFEFITLHFLWNKIYLYSLTFYKNYLNFISQNHRVRWFGRAPLGTSSPTQVLHRTTPENTESVVQIVLELSQA